MEQDTWLPESSIREAAERVAERIVRIIGHR
jgi:hypothetical protein